MYSVIWLGRVRTTPEDDVDLVEGPGHPLTELIGVVHRVLEEHHMRYVSVVEETGQLRRNTGQSART